MADASGTPTSPDNIPTYNTGVDPPSGKGFNTAMAQIQSIITNLKAGTLASGKILASALTGTVPTANLGSGSATSSTFLRGDQTWAAPAGFVLIDDLTVAGAVLASYDTNARLGGNIPQTYKDLVLSIKGKSDQAAVQPVNIQVNGDSAANYFTQLIFATAATATEVEALAASSAQIGNIGGTTGTGGVIETIFHNYTDPTFVQMWESRWFSAANNSTGTLRVGQVGGYRQVSSALTRINVLPAAGNFAIGSRFTLYGRA